MSLKLPGENFWEHVFRKGSVHTYHFSKQTVKEIDALLAQDDNSRQVNSVFGEGVSPRMRKIRQGLRRATLPAEDILQHQSPRIIYGVALASNFRAILLGKAKKAKYLIPQKKPRETTLKIVHFWIERWLSKRIDQEDVLKELENHTLAYPITHGARVILPQDDGNLNLFASL